MKTGVREPGWGRLISAPLVMAGYLALTVLAFRFGPWPWPVKDPDSLYVYLVATVVLFLAGAIGGSLMSWSWRSPIRSPREPGAIKIAILLMLLSVVLLSIARTASPFPPFVATSSLAVINYSRFVEQNYIRGWWTGLEYAFALLNPFFIVGLTGGALYFARLRCIFKLLFLLACAMYLLVYANIGVNRGFFHLLVLLPLTVGLYYVFSGTMSRRAIAIMVVAGLLGTAIFVTLFAFYISSRDPNSIVGHFVPLGIDARRTGLVYDLLPPGFYPVYESLTRYLGLGYYALSLALAETDYRLGLGLTNSMLIIRKANDVLGDAWYFHTLLPVIEQKHGWSVWSLWHSAYTWFISDFGVIGSLVLVSMIGALYGLVWRQLLRTGSIIALGLFFLMNMMVFFLPANNQIFQSADVFVAFVVLLVAFLAGFPSMAGIRTAVIQTIAYVAGPLSLLGKGGFAASRSSSVAILGGALIVALAIWVSSSKNTLLTERLIDATLRVQLDRSSAGATVSEPSRNGSLSNADRAAMLDRLEKAEQVTELVNVRLTLDQKIRVLQEQLQEVRNSRRR